MSLLEPERGEPSASGLSPTETPRARHDPQSGVHRAVAVPPPILASTALIEELAPLEPARQAGRLAFAVVGGALFTVGAAIRAGVGPAEAMGDASTIAFSAGGALVAAAALPFAYLARAGVALVCSGVLMGLGLQGRGPLAGLAIDGGLLRDVARLVALCGLPAALLFRSRFGEYRGTRLVLAAGIAASVPFVVLGALLAADDGAALVPRVAAGTSVATVIAASLGFLGGGGARSGGVFAGLVLAVLPAEIGLRELTPLADAETGTLAYPLTAVGMVCAGVVAAVALFHLLAGALAQRARCDLASERRAG
ncbi:MAG: hypothetical protein IT376_04335 [Polyangiaceae bacterium]|nr:hypothetical protein [Polyangiaceae bacterium]